jgi:ABC-2 type transport system permease protein
VRTSATLVPALGLIVMTALWLGLPFDWRLAGVAGVTLAYVVIWIAAAALVVAVGRSSDFNLVALLALWLVWVVLGPALVTVAASLRFPAFESLEIAVRQRQGYLSTWDRPVRQTMSLFYERYPEWRDVPVPEDRYSNA